MADDVAGHPRPWRCGACGARLSHSDMARALEGRADVPGVRRALLQPSNPGSTPLALGRWGSEQGGPPRDDGASPAQGKGAQNGDAGPCATAADGGGDGAGGGAASEPGAAACGGGGGGGGEAGLGVTQLLPAGVGDAHAAPAAAGGAPPGGDGGEVEEGGQVAGVAGWGVGHRGGGGGVTEGWGWGWHFSELEAHLEERVHNVVSMRLNAVEQEAGDLEELLRVCEAAFGLRHWCTNTLRCGVGVGGMDLVWAALGLRHWCTSVLTWWRGVFRAAQASPPGAEHSVVVWGAVCSVAP